MIISAILCVLPFLTKAGLLAAEALTLAHMAAITGEVYQHSLIIHDLVESGDSTLMNVLDMLLGAGGTTAALRNAAPLRKTATMQQELTINRRIVALGDVFRKND